MYTEIITDIIDHILTITLNRPEKLNALNRTMLNELIDAFRCASKDDNVRCIIVTGAGRAFCAGADVSTLSARAATLDPASEINPVSGANVDWSDERIRDGGGRLTLEIFECLKPVISACNGAAVGIGATMQCAMDIRLCSETARLGFVFARRGIVPEAASSWFLPRIVGIQRALAWCYSGRVFEAKDAYDAGFFMEMVPADDLLSRARTIAREIADHTSPVSVALIRQMMWRGLGMDHPMEAHKVESRGIYSRGASVDAKEGVSAFLEKRPAKFPMKVSTDMPPYFPWWPPRKYS